MRLAVPGGRRAWGRLLWWLFPFDDPAVRATGVLVVALAVLSAAPLLRDLLAGDRVAVGLHAASSAALLAALVAVRVSAGSSYRGVARSGSGRGKAGRLASGRREVLGPARALLVVVLLLNAAAVLFGLGSAVAASDWCLLLPMVFIQIIALCAITLGRRALWLQLAFSIVATAALVTYYKRGWWGVLTADLGTVAIVGVSAVSLVAIAGGFRSLVARLRAATTEAERRSLSDPLTGALNRRGLELSFPALVAAANHAGDDITVLIADLDHFKQINDTHGHGVGDAVLTATAQALRGAVRGSDLLARFGGEEFVIVARTARPRRNTTGTTSTTSEAAWRQAERCRTAVSGADTAVPVTTSIGGVCRPPPPADESYSTGTTSPTGTPSPTGAPGTTGTVATSDTTGAGGLVDWLHAAVTDADKQLYEAKRLGRNRSVLDPPPTATGAGEPVADPPGRTPRDRPAPSSTASSGEPERDPTCGRRRSDRRLLPIGTQRVLRQLDASVGRAFPDSSAVVRTTAALCLAMPVPAFFALVLNQFADSGPWQLDALWGSALLAAAALALGFRRRVARVFPWLILLLEAATMFYGFAEALEPAPNAGRLVPMMYVGILCLAALVLRARTLRWHIAAATVATGLQFGLATSDAPAWALVEITTSAGLVLLIVVTTTGAVQLLLERLRHTLAETERLGELDPLTGVANRRGLERRLPDLLNRARATGDALLVGVADLDHFKRVNDTYGHAVGDQVLQATARALGTAAQAGQVARFGGEEFVVLTPAADATTATEIAEGLRHQVSLANTSPPATASLGAVLRPPPATGDDPVTWLYRTLDDADELLYVAKRQGRDRCVLSVGNPPAPAEETRQREPKPAAAVGAAR